MSSASSLGPLHHEKGEGREVCYLRRPLHIQGHSGKEWYWPDSRLLVEKGGSPAAVCAPWQRWGAQQVVRSPGGPGESSPMFQTPQAEHTGCCVGWS